MNEVLRRAMTQGQSENLEEEAAAFFAGDCEDDRAEAKAMQKAALRTFCKD